MRGKELARLQHASGATHRIWSDSEYVALLDQKSTCLLFERNAFILGQVLGDEAEIVMIAVDLAAQRQGIGKTILEKFEAEMRGRGVLQCFLEVSDKNGRAKRLYLRAGYHIVGRRKLYYHEQDGARCDALILRKDL